MKATRLLMDEHQQILRAIRVVDAMASRVAHGLSIHDGDADFILRFLLVFGDYHHQEREEAILFPSILKGGPAAELHRLSHFTHEHHQQRSLLEGILKALKSRQGHEFVFYAKLLTDIERAHIQAEDNDIFRRADRILTVEEDERIARELADDTSDRYERIPDLLEALATIELRYVSRILRQL